MAKFLGREGGKELEGSVCRRDAPLAAVMTPNSATGIPDDFRAPETVISACAIAKTLH